MARGSACSKFVMRKVPSLFGEANTVHGGVPVGTFVRIITPESMDKDKGSKQPATKLPGYRISRRNQLVDCGMHEVCSSCTAICFGGHPCSIVVMNSKETGYCSIHRQQHIRNIAPLSNKFNSRFSPYDRLAALSKAPSGRSFPIIGLNDAALSHVPLQFGSSNRSSLLNECVPGKDPPKSLIQQTVSSHFLSTEQSKRKSKEREEQKESTAYKRREQQPDVEKPLDGGGDGEEAGSDCQPEGKILHPPDKKCGLR